MLRDALGQSSESGLIELAGAQDWRELSTSFNMAKRVQRRVLAGLHWRIGRGSLADDP
jgi:hypothetical protein